MPWWKRRRRDQRRSEELSPAAVSEFLDPHHERTFLVGDDDTALVQPGKILDNLKLRMERFAIDPLLEASVDEFLSIEEAAALMRLGLGRILITSTAEWAADLLHRELPAQWARHPVPPEVDLVEQSEGRLMLDPRLQEVGRAIFNAATSDPLTGAPDRSKELAGPDTRKSLYLRRLQRGLRDRVAAVLVQVRLCCPSTVPRILRILTTAAKTPFTYWHGGVPACVGDRWRGRSRAKVPEQKARSPVAARQFDYLVAPSSERGSCPTPGAELQRSHGS